MFPQGLLQTRAPKPAVSIWTIAAVATLVITTTLALPAVAAALEQRETQTRSFLLPAGGTLVVDNMRGAIEIEAVDGDRVELELHATWEGRDATELAHSRETVQLEVDERPGHLELVQGGYCRCRGNCGFRADRCRGGWGDDREDPEARFDWKLKVPRSVDLEVENVADGAIRVTGTRGRLRVANVEGGVTLRGVAGVVEARTVNGSVTAEFTSAPTGDSAFATVNGDIDLSFPRGFGAELSFHTLNGEVYTDFPFTPAKLRPTSARSEDGQGRRFHVGESSGAVLGAGGFALACDTINGDITIRERR